MKISEINCKTALSKSGIYGWKYALNPYRGCLHGCKYCYAPNILRARRDTWGKNLGVKKNIPIILAKELKKLSNSGTGAPLPLVGISSVTDPYQEAEEKYNLTRYCLEQLLKYKFPISIITKSHLILRDIDLLKKFSYSELTISITTLDDELASVLEPEAPTITKRLEALTKLSKEGFNTYAFLGPLLPTLEYSEVPELINRIVSTGVTTVMLDTLNLKPVIWQDLKTTLDNQPTLGDKFYKRLFKDKSYYPKIFELIKTECIGHGVKIE